MFKLNWKMLLITSLMCLLPIFVGFIRLYGVDTNEYYLNLGTTTYVLTKTYSILFMPLLLLDFNFVANVLIDVFSKNKKRNKNKKLDFFRWCMPVISIIVQGMYINKCLYGDENNANILVLFLVCGFLIYSYYLFSCDLGSFITVKNKWTKNNWIVCKITNKIVSVILIIIAIIDAIAACMEMQDTIFISSITTTVLIFSTGPISKIIYEINNRIIFEKKTTKRKHKIK